MIEIVREKVKEDKLKFKYQYHEWDQTSSMNLLHFIYEKKNQDKQRELNETTLLEIFQYFEKKFSKDILRRKCISYGIKYRHY